MKIRTTLACIGILAVLLSSVVVFGAPAKIARDLDSTSSARVNVIVQFTTTPTERHFNMMRRHGGALKMQLAAVKGGLFSMPATELESLAADPEVAYISPDRALKSTSAPGNPTLTLDYHLAAVNAGYAASLGLNGAGVGVAVIDSGISADMDLFNVVYSQNMVNNAGGSAMDAYGHGTHVAGILAGNGHWSAGPPYFYTFMGVAPGAALVNLRVLNGAGVGQDSDVINAIQQAINLKALYNIRVINLSLGRPVAESYTLDPLCQAVEAAWKAGITVVVAAGNDGRDNSFGTNGYLTIGAPANDPYVITVGAMNTMGTPTRTDDVITSYSSKGPTPLDHLVKPDLVAPGNRIISDYTAGSYLSVTYPANEIAYSLYETNGSSAASSYYFCLSGTSMATPVVSGAVALLLQQHPGLTPDQVKARLMVSAYKALPPYATATDPTTGDTYNMQGDIFTVGAGYLDIQAALQNTNLAPPGSGTAISPPVTYTTSNGVTSVTIVNPMGSVWGQSPAWADTAVWGTNVVINSNGALWGNSAVWGSGSATGFSVVWGRTVAWSTTTGDDSESAAVAIYGEN